MENIYEKCPILESENYILKLIEKSDTEALFKVYSDKNSVPFFNSDNCDGDDFYYKTMERMQEAVDFWVNAYANKWFVRWTITDKCNNEIIGTIEAFHRDSDDIYNGYGLFRLDLISNYEKEEVITEITKLLLPNVYKYFGCTKCMTKAVKEAVERRNALTKAGFTEVSEPMIGGNDRKEYFNYWVK